MVKLNFKETSSIPASSKDKKEEVKGQHPEREEQQKPKEEFDISFESTESFFPKVEEEPEQEPSRPTFFEENESSTTEKESSAGYSFEDEESSFKSTITQKKLYLIFGAIAGALLVIIFIILQLIKTEDDGKIAEQPKTETTTTEQTSGGPTSQAMLSVYQNNMANNRFINQQLINFIDKKPNSADYSLIVLTPSEMNLTVLADSRNQIAEFHIDLKQNFPNYAFRIISAQSMLEGNVNKIYADISAKIDPNQILPSSANISVSVQPQNISSEIKELTQQNDVNLQYFKEGKITDRNNYREIFYYVNIGGKKDNILQFLADMVNSYPMLRINKFSIYPYNLETITDQNLLTRINFTYYNSK